MSVAGFKVLLHRRSMTINELAQEARVGRSHLSQVLNGKPGRGGQTRRKVAVLLTVEELNALGWDGHGNVSTHLRGGHRNFPEGAARGVPLAAAVPSTGRATQEIDAGMATLPAEQSRTRQSAGKRGEILKGSLTSVRATAPHSAGGAKQGKTILDLERE